jgi:endonuclease III
MPRAPKPKRAAAPSKEAIAQALAQQARQVEKVERSKRIARAIWPAVTGLATVYEAQTAFNAVSGHLLAALVKPERELKVSDLMADIDLETGKPSPVKHAVKSIIDYLQHEPAKDAQELLDLMGRKLPEALAQKHIQDPMDTIAVDDFIAK